MRSDLPAHIHGAAVIVDERAMNDLIHRLHNGDPTKGWEGDPWLFLAFDKEQQRFQLWRTEHDGENRLVAQSPVGMAFPHNIIDELVARDTRRGFDFVKHVTDRMEQEEAERDRKFKEAIAPANEKAAWAIARGDY